MPMEGMVGGIGLRCTPDFRYVVVWQDTEQMREFHLTASQAAVVRTLTEATGWGAAGEVSQEFILEAVDSRCRRLRDLFRRPPGAEAWGTLIVPGKTKGTVRLSVSPVACRQHAPVANAPSAAGAATASAADVVRGLGSLRGSAPRGKA